MGKEKLCVLICMLKGYSIQLIQHSPKTYSNNEGKKGKVLLIARTKTALQKETKTPKLGICFMSKIQRG